MHAVLFALEARIDNRLLEAKAQRRSQARETYEDALERGKTSILHEEVLRGVHMLSVGHIPPGAEIEVRASWAMTLTNINGRGHLRIPLTVGEIYGRSALAESDDLIHGAANQSADLTVSCLDGQVRLIGGRLQDGAARVPLDAPIELEVSNWTPHDLCGGAADGRKVVLRVEPAPNAEAALDVALMIDRSGSMQEQCSAGRKRTKHATVVRCLQDAASSIGRADIIEVWEFSDDFGLVGSTRDGQSLKAIVRRLNAPDGGTDIGRALAGLVERSRARDVLLVTDGKSHALDVQALARTGHRYSVVLVGEDSLEANVGHLAALTQGEVFVAGGADLAEVLHQALRSLRTSHKAPGRMTGAPESLSVSRAGMSIAAGWHRTEEPVPTTIDARAVAALSASLALPALDADSAAELAEAENLVTHLTSLVLIDEAAPAHAGIPGARKVPLPTPRTAHAMSACPMAPPFALRETVVDLCYALGARSVGYRDLSRLGGQIDWDLAPERLRNGDLSELEEAIARPIRDAAACDEVDALARHLGISPVALVIGLIARAQAASNRTAARLAKAILSNAGDEELAVVARMLGLG